MTTDIGKVEPQDPRNRNSNLAPVAVREGQRHLAAMRIPDGRLWA